MSYDVEQSLPGTQRFFNEDGSPLVTDSRLAKSGNVVLVPQPTGSPNDPLNWSLSKKIWMSSILCFITALTAATSNDAGASEYDENLEFNISEDAWNIGAGILFIGIGYAALFLSPASYLYGRRLPYLISMLFGVVGSIWFAVGRSEANTEWNQLFVGASESVCEANVQMSLMELWFQHRRGAVLGVYILATSVGTYLGPLIASYIADSALDWEWIGWLGAIVSGFALILVFFGLDETAFDRAGYLLSSGEPYFINGVDAETSSASDPAYGHFEQADADADAEKSTAIPTMHFNSQKERNGRPSTEHREPEKKKTYWQRIAVITPSPNLRGLGFKQYGKRLVHTLRVFSFPPVLFSGLIWGWSDVLLTFYITVEDTNWYGPPWNYTDAAVGNMSIPALIGAVIGCIYGGWFSDQFVQYTARRNRGVFEAEQRLWLLFPIALFCPAGLLLFGLGTQAGLSWPVPYIGLAFLGFSFGCSGDLTLSYVADAYPEMVLEGMIGVSVINNSLACAFTFAATPWLEASGVQDTFIVLSVLSFVLIMTTLAMIIWGKRCRMWTKVRYESFLKLRDGMN